MFEESQIGQEKLLDYREAIVFAKKLYLNQNVFSHENEMPLFLHSSGLNSVIEKPRFRDGLVCTVGLGGKIKLRFQISPE